MSTHTPAEPGFDTVRPVVGDIVRFRATFLAADRTVFDERWLVTGADDRCYEVTGQSSGRTATAPKTALYRL